ncbi:ABC transporter permease [Amnibacterium flavum]|uniref:ABC transporter permease n=1 Tax=Amnibacterium flavum TaxID=2173173 RepID=A0A2V1HW62_9MICO|nr:ABC transporter permease [Amnibacterium flavum]PVZ95379.1 ABC transporter permease [Amnibacterium flavum]
MRVARFLGIRLLQAIPLLIATSALSFLLLRLAPGDPAKILAGPRASEEVVAKLRTSMGLDEPIPVQYWKYLQRVFAGDLGKNLNGNADVADIISRGVGVTGLLAVVAIIITILVAIPVALAAARRPGGPLDNSIRVASVASIAVPGFWIGLMLIAFVALPTKWFPVGGWPDDSSRQFNAILLPAITLAIGIIPVLTRSLRSAFIDVLGAEYVTAARSLGIPGGRLIRRFVLRNAAVPAIPVLAFLIGFVVGGSVVIESTFNLPGLGQTLVQAALTRDANVLQALTLVLGTSVVAIYVIADVAVSLTDPRVSLT